MSGPRGWYIDEDILDVYRALSEARRKVGDVHGVPCRCCPDPSSDDVDWLPFVGRNEWAVVTHDARILRVLAERQAVIDNRVGVFLLRWRGDIETFERIRLAFRRWEDMVRIWDRETRPFAYAITRNQAPRRLDL